MGKPVVCKACGREGHTKFTCRSVPRKRMQQSKPLRHEAPKTRVKRLETARAWHEANPPDEYGMWTCYLQISPNCYRLIDITTLNREHVVSKTRSPKRKYDVTNIRPACPPCNELKGSRNASDFGIE